MKIEKDIVTFRFCFRTISSKTESLLALKSFLHDKGWLPENVDYDTELIVYHTTDDGTCEVILKKIPEHTTEGLADMFFSDLQKDEEVYHVAVLYNPHSDKLVQTHAGKYLHLQKVRLDNLRENDEVVILHRQ